MRFTRRRRGIGLTGVVLLLALLYFTGVLNWMWTRIMMFEQECYRLVGQTGVGSMGSVCQGIGNGLTAIDQATSDVSGTAMRAYESVTQHWSGIDDVESVIGRIEVPSALRRIGSSNSQLDSYIKFGPRGLGQTAQTVKDQARMAMDSFSIGQRFLGSDYSSAQAVPWLQKGAAVPGYGLLSQLSLGDIYRNGTGVSRDFSTAEMYYTNAYESVSVLQRSNTPEAQAILKSLPGSPQEIQAKLNSVILQLRKSIPAQ